MSKKSKTTAQKFGKFFAHMQAALDDFSEWGFSHLKKVGKNTEKTEDDSLGFKAKKGLKKVAHFFGEMGESFYSEYKAIKSKKK